MRPLGPIGHAVVRRQSVSIAIVQKDEQVGKSQNLPVVLLRNDGIELFLRSDITDTHSLTHTLREVNPLKSERCVESNEHNADS